MSTLIILFGILGGLFLVLFLPGLLLSYILLNPKQTGVIERISISFALSIAIVPLAVFYTSLIGIPITTVTIMHQIIFILCFLIMAIFIKRLLK